MKAPCTIPLRSIRIDDPFWNRYTRLVTEKMLPYQWQALHDRIEDAPPSHCIRNFRIAAGEEEGRFHGFVFQDSDLAKWLEAAAYSLFWQPDPELEKQMEDAIALIGRAQQPDGYLNTYFTIEAPDSRFRNLRNGHELYVAGHMIEAGVAHYQATGKRTLLDIVCAVADQICQVFRSQEFAAAYPGHEEIELALIRLFEVTGNKDYLDMAKAFVDRRGVDSDYFQRESRHPKWISLFGEVQNSPADLKYHQCHLPVREQKQAEGHAVRAVYLYCAMADLAREYEDQALLRSCETLFQNIAQRRMYITGAIGSSGILERFTCDFDLPRDRGYGESCASIGLALFCRRMLRNTWDGKYADVVERALMNTVTAATALSGEAFFYVNPLEVWPENCLPGTSMEHVKPVRQRWFGCACCPPNIARTLASLGEYAVMSREDTVWINLFLSSQFTVSISGVPVQIQCETRFPFSEDMTFTVQAEEPVQGCIALRLPDYVSRYTLIVDGVPASVRLSRGYLYLDQLWNGQTITYSVSIPPRFVFPSPEVHSCAGRAAVMKGPLVYCMEEIDNGKNLSSLAVHPSLGLREEYDPSLLGGCCVIYASGTRMVAEEDALYRNHPPRREKTELKLIPYCLWGNRTSGEMQAWIRDAEE